MQEAWEFIKQLVNPESIIYYGGLWLLVAVIFAETGLFFGFFLPGDSLLFIAGLFCYSGKLDANIFVLLGSISVAAILGNMVGYAFGKRVGVTLYKRGDTLFLKQRHVNMAAEFYERNGGKAIIMGRFLPIFRTFVPIVAGIIKMDYKTFMAFNIAGSVLWVFGIILSGYFLGHTIPGIEEYLEYIVLGLIAITSISPILTYLKERRRSRQQSGTSA